MRRRATFTLLAGLPKEYGADELEVVTASLIKFLESGKISVLNITWSCPEIGRKTTPPGPVLAFERKV